MELPTLWPNRDASLQHLRSKQPSRLRVVQALFDAIDECVDLLQDLSPTTNGPYSLACAIAATKGKNLAKAALGTIADGYGQESGALLRPLLEYIELLAYFESFPSETDAAFEDRLPPAGERARRIQGKFQVLREHLNKNASHGSYSVHSVGHLIRDDLRVNKSPNFSPEVFDVNFRTLTVFLIFLLAACVFAIRHISEYEMRAQEEKFHKLVGRARDVFDFPLGPVDEIDSPIGPA